MRDRYAGFSERLRPPTALFGVTIGRTPGGVAMGFRKDQCEGKKGRTLFGRSLLVTGKHGWTA